MGKNEKKMILIAQTYHDGFYKTETSAAAPQSIISMLSRLTGSTIQYVTELDGYHALNDLILKRSLFASEKTARIATLVLIGLMASGLLGDLLGYAVSGALLGVGRAFEALYSLVGLI